MKIAIIGAGKPGKTELEALIKAVEEKTGEQVELVNLHEGEFDLPEQTMPFKFDLTFKPVDLPPPEPKRKGHVRPYKYHP